MILTDQENCAVDANVTENHQLNQRSVNNQINIDDEDRDKTECLIYIEES